MIPHTPGPWTVHDLWNNNPCIENGGVFEVEEAHYDVKERLEAGCDVERVIKGNARLIAQAPAMYALLKELELITHVAHGFYCCPICGGEIEDKNRNRGVSTSALGHNTDCRLAAVLKAAEEPDAR